MGFLDVIAKHLGGKEEKKAQVKEVAFWPLSLSLIAWQSIDFSHTVQDFNIYMLLRISNSVF